MRVPNFNKNRGPQFSVKDGDNEVTFIKRGDGSVYPMFFGVLLTALHKHNAITPIFGVSLGDVDRSFENTKAKLHQLVEFIATGKYGPSGQVDRA